MDNKTINIAIFGGGVVGGGVIEILEKYKNINIKYLCVKDKNKKRDFNIPKNTILVEDYTTILYDNTIDIFVELMGGTNEALKIVTYLLNNNKNVVTANKKLIAQNIKYIKHSLDKSTSKFCFEASVCGGIPIISTLKKHYTLQSFLTL